MGLGGFWFLSWGSTDMTVTLAVCSPPLSLAVVVVGFSQTLFTISESRRTVDVGVELLFGIADVGFDVIVSTVNNFDAVGQ